MNRTLTPESSISAISPADAQQKRVEALLLDVRTPAEFEEAHIEGSILLPLGDLNPEEVKRLATGKSACVLVCRSGNRARQAAEKLKTIGLPSLHLLAGGVLAWDAAGLPLDRGASKVISLERQVRIAAGAIVVLGVVLAQLVHPLFMGLSAFVGCGLIFAGLTDRCGMGMLIAKAPWNQL
jgi:rhodanese-related sulfurtransferase